MHGGHTVSFNILLNHRRIFSPPGGSKQTRAPTNDHQNNSQTETSNENGVFCRIVSSSDNGYFSASTVGD